MTSQIRAMDPERKKMLSTYGNKQNGLVIVYFGAILKGDGPNGRKLPSY